MSFKPVIFIGLLALYLRSFSQDYFSYGSSNFGGLTQVILNPASAADNRLKTDVILLGLDVNVNNSWFAIKREALNYTGSLFHPATLKFPATWKNVTPNVPDNVFKNFVVVSSGKDHAAIIENRVIMPSFMVQIDQKNAIAFTWSVRQIANMDGIGPQLANLFEKELDLSVTQNNRIQNKSLNAVQMTWAEYGITYARVLKDKNKHFIKAGITPKLLQGIESSFVIIKNMDLLLSTKDTNSYFKGDFAYAHSANVNTPTLPGSYRFVSKPALGLDLGIVYEWRPDYQKYKYKPDGKNYAWRKDRNKYKLRLGASINDIGRLKFAKEGAFYDLSISAHNTDFTKFTSTGNFHMFDSMLRADFSSKEQSQNFYMMLPTALNLQADYSLNRFFYLNLSAHLSNFFTTSYRVYNYSALCFAPRFEHYWVDVSLLITYNALSAARSKYITAGLNMRVGPVQFGTNNFMPFFKGNVSDLNFYAMVRMPVPYKMIKDRDGDGVWDKKDLCPDEPGEMALQGCPDKDQDQIPDKDDACPHQPGIAAFRGCPDTDNDGVADAGDACPTEKGPIYLKGCPDLDGDSIPDKEDACPDMAGLRQFKGCPDTDGDGIIDKEDLCPTVKGLAKYQGCNDSDNDGMHDGIDQCPDMAGPAENKGCPWPDTDKDGIIDRLDSCVNVPGVAAYKGCPAPVKLAPAEKRILQKAFSSLEFETGKDVIKPVSFPSLNALAKLMVAHQADWKIKLSGHTDNEGTEESNMLLSEKRAKAVQHYLVKKGVPIGITVAEWFGQSRPVADNSTKEGRRKNRRVEMSVSGTE